MLSARGHHRNDKPPIRCPLCSCTGHYSATLLLSALQCREFQTTRREKKPTDIRETEDMAATSEAAEMAFSKTTHSSVRRADARLPRGRHRSIPFRPQYARFPLPTPRNWPPRNQGPPSRRYMEPQTPLTTARSMVTVRATKTRANIGATRGQVHRVRHRN